MVEEVARLRIDFIPLFTLLRSSVLTVTALLPFFSLNDYSSEVLLRDSESFTRPGKMTRQPTQSPCSLSLFFSFLGSSLRFQI